MNKSADTLTASHPERVDRPSPNREHDPRLAAGTRPGLAACWAAVALGIALPQPAQAGQETTTPSAVTRPERLTDLALEQLMDIEVTSVSRAPQKVSESAAAVYVITQQDIRRSGATSIAEALRMAPGLNVARIGSSTWAISSRGFNDFFANKLLVLMDGRSVYTPLFSGVFWDVQDTMMEDIERIEVIRGPGASLWGANAVNGVINIVTKSAAETQGGLFSGGGGKEEVGFGSLRYGGKIAESGYYRAYVKYFDRDDFVDAAGRDAANEWDMIRGGFRTDWNVSEKDSLTLQGDYYHGTVGSSSVVFPPPTFFRILNGRGRVSGGNVLGLWKHSFTEDSDIGLQLYYDRTERDDQVHRELRDTYDVDFQHRLPLGSRQEFIWGLGYRYTTDDLSDGRAKSGAITFNPSRRGDQLFSAFIQDEIVLAEDLLRLTLGTKLEHNDYTEFEVQPSGRLLWTPHDQHTFWTAVSRAIRSPARFEHTVRAWIPTPPSILIGNGNYESETVEAYEFGYRFRPSSKVFFDLATFYNEYDDLLVGEDIGFFPVLPRPFPPVEFLQAENGMSGETYGAEIAMNWDVTDWWDLKFGYTWLQMQLHRRGATGPSTSEGAEGDSPHHQFHVRSFVDLPYNLQLDSAVYYVDNLPTRNVPGYVRWDARVGWQPKNNLDLSVGVHNILDDRHLEFGPGFLVIPTEVQRTIYGKLTWRF